MAKILHTIGMAAGALGAVSLGWMGTALSQALDTPAPATATDWQQVRDFFRRENDDRGAGRDNTSRPIDGVCLVSPKYDQPLWHRNPVLVWQSRDSTVGIRPLGEDNNIFWQDIASETEAGVYSAYYQGEPLELGQTYQWLFYDTDPVPYRWFKFHMMTTEQYEHYADALEAVQSELETNGADEIEIALAQSEYFIENNLPIDALQVIFAVDEPSEELLEIREELVQEICGRPNPAQNL